MKRTTGFVILLLMLSVPAFAGEVNIHRPDGRVIVLHEPVNVVQTNISNSLTTYTITDGNADELGEPLTLAVRQTGARQTMAMVDTTGRRTEILPGSRTERDFLALIATHT